MESVRSAKRRVLNSLQDKLVYLRRPQATEACIKVAEEWPLIPFSAIFPTSYKVV